MRLFVTASILLISLSAFGRSLRDVVPWAGTVALVEVGSSDVTITEEWIGVELVVTIIEVLEGDVVPGCQVTCSYMTAAPGVYESMTEEEMEEVIEEFGSGLEFDSESGDTVIVLLDARSLESGDDCGLVRLESPDTRKVILKLLTLRQ